jgi:cytochrome b6-f complex iron-sulfur subunit
MAKKQSTADIIARLRAESKGQGGETAAAPAAQAAEKPVSQEAPPAEASASSDQSADASEAGIAAAPPKPAGGKPKSTKDILAALRAEGGAGKSPAGKAAAAAPAAAKPASPKPAGKPSAGKQGKPVAAADGDGPRPSVQEMLKAARAGRPLEGPAEEKPPARPQPKVPAAARKAKDAVHEEAKPSRRSILLAAIATPFALAWTSFTLATAAFTLGMARFMMPNVLVEPPSRFKVGPLSDYPPDSVSEKWKAEYGVWLVNTMYNGQRQIYALISVCTHLGCTPNWLQGEQKFKCPCHGSGFYISGINFEGPAPRPLERAGISLAPDGMLEVDKSVKFQEEMGQWSDASSYVPVV